MQEKICRLHYRAQFRKNLSSTEKEAVLCVCRENARALIHSGRCLTAALYYYYDDLFLYYEAVGEALTPEVFMAPLGELLVGWPSMEGARKWAQMYQYYYHCIPQGVADWRRKTPPQRRRGRIAKLDHDRMFSYMYHHCAIVREGYFPGDPYQSIAVHEDILFSYFEEPRGSINIVRDLSKKSKAIDEWSAADPGAHFVPFPEADGANFLLLEDYFALGESDR